jgi:hypothetical protein|tara:strand:- start:176 stop:439 length:264 start_codon:yes stop_codon:yes gene_type:complete
MSKVKEMKVNKITEKQLKTVTEQQTKMNDLLRHIGLLDVQKLNAHAAIKEVTVKIDETKKELEEQYGQVNIDLKDGSYTDIEQEDDK